MLETSDGMCTSFRERAICSWNAASQARPYGSLAGSGIHEKVNKHAKGRHTGSRNRTKHSPVVQMIAGLHACVFWMYVEQQIAPFQQRPWQKKKICVCLYSHACMYCEARMGCAQPLFMVLVSRSHHLWAYNDRCLRLQSRRHGQFILGM